MPITPTYPGVYIQELPSSVHTITPAPTSIATFIGYTHPFLTQSPGQAIQLFSFADYQANFGGFFSSPWQPDYVGQAVYQFFLNGGSTCYVVGLKPGSYWDDSTTPATDKGSIVAAAVTVGTGKTITFTAQQPVGIPASGSNPAVGLPMEVTISNVTKTTAANDTADIVVSYGTVVETYRRVLISNVVSALGASQLVTVTVSATPPVAYPTTGSPFSLAYASVPQSTWTVLNTETDFATVFEAGQSLDLVPIFNILVLPGITDATVIAEAVAYAEKKRAFLIIDPPASWAVQTLTATSPLTLSPAPPISTNAALYYPWLDTTDPVTGAASTAPPSGFVAGIYAMEDAGRGVWKSPAGIETAILGTTGVATNGVMNDAQQGVLNTGGVNCLRDFAGTGTVVFGARTTASTNQAYQQWKYVGVRRMALFLEQSLYANLTWAIFEPNAQPLWTALTQEVNAFMLSLFRQGAFAGTTPSTSFSVQCDSTTTTPNDVALGVVNLIVSFAPLEPAEFVVVQIAQLAGQASS